MCPYANQRSKRDPIKCTHPENTAHICAFLRYCSVTGKYSLTAEANGCFLLLKEREDKKCPKDAH